MTNPAPVHRGMSNEFEARSGSKTINFRNKTNLRTSVSSIEIHGEDEVREILINPEDNVAMALSLLGLGRVDDDVEQEANNRADMLLSENHGHTIDGVLTQAVVNLRAILIAQERQKQASETDIKDAYALYLLAYPKSEKTFEVFKEMEMQKHWITNLRKVRKDPTILGSL